MKKLALAIGLGAFVAFGTAGDALAAYRVDNTSGFSAIRDSNIARSVKGANERLLALNMALYPEAVADPQGVLCIGEICVSAD
jgi:hypothetical protein